MIIKYNGSGKIKFGLCTGYFKKTYILHKFKPGDVAWLSYKAKKGKLESISIRKLIFTGGPYSTNKIFVIYKDNNNFYYNPDELITHNEAIELVKSYLYEELLHLVEAKNNCVINKNLVAKKY